MATTTIHYRTLPGTRASVGHVGNHSLIADRPPGKFGGMGLGFNGGELLAAAIGGCFCNDMQAIADEMNLAIDDLQVSVDVDFAGDPVRASGARVAVRCLLADGSDPAELIERAKAATTIGNSLQVRIPLSFSNS
jgi:organic hydroperoxide reductase OsmC/OhrA